MQAKQHFCPENHYLFDQVLHLIWLKVTFDQHNMKKERLKIGFIYHVHVYAAILLVFRMYNFANFVKVAKSKKILLLETPAPLFRVRLPKLLFL